MYCIQKLVIHCELRYFKWYSALYDRVVKATSHLLSRLHASINLLFWIVDMSQGVFLNISNKYEGQGHDVIGGVETLIQTTSKMA